MQSEETRGSKTTLMMQGQLRYLSALAGSVSAALFAATVQATVITTGVVYPVNLMTNPSTTNQITVGYSASSGRLEVNANSTGNGFTTVNSSLTTFAGNSSGSDGTIVIVGNGAAGSAILNSSSIFLGWAGGSGHLTVQNGGLVESTARFGSIQAGNVNSSGTILVDGANSVLKSADRIEIGAFDNSSGSLRISNGGVTQANGVVYIGLGENATGSATVTGLNSKMLTNGLVIGGSNVGGTTTNTGTLTIQNGATVTANPLPSGVGGPTYGGVVIGSKTESQLTVTGAGSSLQVGAITSGTDTNVLAGKEVIVGGYGQGRLVVDQSATVNATGANIIVGESFFGTYNDAGTLTVKNGGTVTADSITISQNGLLNGSGGTITGDVTISGGTLAPGNSPGTMNINGDLHLLSGILNLEVASGISDHLNVSGNVFFAEDIIINLDFLSSPVSNTFNIEDFFSNFASFVVNPAFNLATHLHVNGLSSSDFITVSLAGSSVDIGQTAMVPEPGSLLLLIAGVGAMFAVRRSRNEWDRG